jgi:hypothetical protein
MKLSALLAAAVLGLATLNARAEVLIYTGNARVTELAVRNKPFVRKAFLVADPAGKSTQLVTYGKLNGVKSRDSESIRIGDFLSGALTPGGPLLDIYTFLQSSDTSGILRESLFMRGYQRSVQVNLSQGDPVKAMRAKFLKGSVRRLVGSLGSSYIEREVSLEFDRERTVGANVRGLTAGMAYDELLALLEARGFTEL